MSGLAACPHCGRGFTRAALLDLQVLPPPDCPDCGGALRVRWQLPVSLFLTGTGIPISLVELTGSVPVGLASFTIVMALWFAAFPRLSPLAEGARR